MQKLEKMKPAMKGKYESMFIYHFGPKDEKYNASKAFKKENSNMEPLCGSQG